MKMNYHLYKLSIRDIPNLFSRVDPELSKSNLAMGEIKMADARWQNIGARSAQINSFKLYKKFITLF